MAFKFPFTNYHELNLTWVLDQLKKLFEESAENVSTIQNYDGRLTAVETELPSVSETASEASRAAAAAGSLAQTAKATADTAQENAVQAQVLAGTSRQEAQAAQTAANEATQTAQQAQATAQNFDGRITQAENDASQALEASRSFENRVQSAITTANNAAQTATNAQGIAMRADQNAGAAMDKIGDLSQLTTTAKNNLVSAINEAAQSGGVTSVNGKTGAVVIDASDIGYNGTTVETALDGKQNAPTAAGTVGQVLGLDNNLQPVWVDQTGGSGDNSNCAPIIINTASGAVASFSDGANNRQIRQIIGTIVPQQSGTGDPSPDNVRPISGWTGAEIDRTGKNLFDSDVLLQASGWTVSAGVYSGYNYGLDRAFNFSKGGIPGLKFKENTRYTFSSKFRSEDAKLSVFAFGYTDGTKSEAYWNDTTETRRTVTSQANKTVEFMYMSYGGNSVIYLSDCQLEESSTATAYEPYTGNQISVDWEDEADTVYGGTLTLNPDRTGILVVDRALVDLGKLTWIYNTGRQMFSNNLVGAADKWNGVICSNYKTIPSPYDQSDYTVGLTQWSFNNGQINVVDHSFNGDVTAFKTAMNGVIAVYELATPIEHKLTESEIIGILTTLYGTNNVWIDTGSITEVQYPADTKLYIDNKIAELQALVLEQ